MAGTKDLSKNFLTVGCLIVNTMVGRMSEVALLDQVVPHLLPRDGLNEPSPDIAKLVNEQGVLEMCLIATQANVR